MTRLVMIVGAAVSLSYAVDNVHWGFLLFFCLMWLDKIIAEAVNQITSEDDD
jgi:uncharacterized membrane protein